MILPSMSEVSSFVKARRLALGVTQTELSQLAGLSRSTIAAIESGAISEIGLNRVSKLISVLNKHDLNIHTRLSFLAQATSRGFNNSRTKEIGLSIPYDWSNPNISDDALILNVLKRGFFEDICRICYYFGYDKVNLLVIDINDEFTITSTRRMMRNIKNGMDDQTGSATRLNSFVRPITHNTQTTAPIEQATSPRSID